MGRFNSNEIDKIIITSEFIEGERARDEGKSLNDNPYKDIKCMRDWSSGWCDRDTSLSAKETAMLTDSELLKYKSEYDLILDFFPYGYINSDEEKLALATELAYAITRYREMRHGDTLMDLQPGERSDCKQCGKEIVWNGEYWYHCYPEFLHDAIPEEKPKTVKVKIAVAVDKKGNYSACGDSLCEDHDELMARAAYQVFSGEAQYWLTTELEIPEVKEIEVSDIEKVTE